MKSINGGETWFAITNGLDINQEFYKVIVDKHNPDVLYLATQWNGVFISRNGGISWTAWNQGLTNTVAGTLSNVTNPMVMSADGLFLYFGTAGSGVFRRAKTAPVACIVGGDHFRRAKTAPVACIVGGDQTVEAGVGCEARVTLDGSCSKDADSTPGTNDDIEYFDWYEIIDPCDANSNISLGSGEIIECNLPLGEHIVALEVTDKADMSDTNEVTITVEDMTAPVITLNGPEMLVLECGVDSYTEEGATAMDNCDEDVEGTYVITYDATDDSGNLAEQVTRTVIVEDTTPPEFSLSVAPEVLWPANHKMVEITPSWEVSDNCDEWPEVTLVSITMNEDDDGKGDGHTTDDIQIGDEGIWLRAERSGRGTGRVYTITYQAADDSGNVAVDSAVVTVPHNRRKN
jgi:hypothetical protein